MKIPDILFGLGLAALTAGMWLEFGLGFALMAAGGVLLATVFIWLNKQESKK
jgi:hypothetical protein